MRSGPTAVTFFYAKLDSVHPGECPMMWKHMCVTGAVVLSVTVAVLAIPKTVTPVAAPAKLIQKITPKPAVPSQANLDSLPDRITVCRDAIKALGRRVAIDRFPVC